MPLQRVVWSAYEYCELLSEVYKAAASFLFPFFFFFDGKRCLTWVENDESVSAMICYNCQWFQSKADQAGSFLRRWQLLQKTDSMDATKAGKAGRWQHTSSDHLMYWQDRWVESTIFRFPPCYSGIGWLTARVWSVISQNHKKDCHDIWHRPQGSERIDPDDF